MSIVVYSSWDDSDDEDLLEYVKNQNEIPSKIISEDEILKEDPKQIRVLFANTKTVQQLIPKYTVPETYPTELNHLYRRNLRKMKFSDAINSPSLPFFIKPAKNDKQFQGMSIQNEYDVTYLKTFEADEVYVCDFVKFVCEFRLFIGDNMVHGMVESTDFILDAPAGVHTPPSDFIDEVLKANPYFFCVIDVGLTEDNVWMVVEVNPPFALSSYNWPIENYYNYCSASWNSIVNNL